MKKKVIILILLLLPLNYTYSFPSFFYEKRSFEYASQLLRKNDYYRAITEFKRYIFFGKDKFLIEKSKYTIGLAYLMGGDYKNARNQFNLLLYDNSSPFSESALLRLGDVDFFKTVETIKIHKHYEFSPARFEGDYYSRYLRDYPSANGYVEAYNKLLFVTLLNFDFKNFYSLANSVNRPKNDAIIDEFKLKAEELKDITQKSVTFAKIISIIIPGAGQIYAGEFNKGVVALLVNAAFIGASYYTYTNYSKLLGIILGYYELSFYFGNINNAGLAVEKYNENEKNRYRKRMLNIYSKRLNF